VFGRLGTPTLVKLLIAVAGILVFGWGIRTEDRSLRWWGIALVGVAAALRFWKERSPSGDAPSEP
jgi:hypothetical protein